MSKEYIEKWSVVNKLTDIENKCQKFKPFNEAEQEMYRLICETEINIGKTPTADVVEVVRCKDCKHWKHFKHLGCTDSVKVCGLANYMIGANGYCLYGERRTDNA